MNCKNAVKKSPKIILENRAFLEYSIRI